MAFQPHARTPSASFVSIGTDATEHDFLTPSDTPQPAASQPPSLFPTGLRLPPFPTATVPFQPPTLSTSPTATLARDFLTPSRTASITSPTANPSPGTASSHAVNPNPLAPPLRRPPTRPFSFHQLRTLFPYQTPPATHLLTSAQLRRLSPELDLAHELTSRLPFSLPALPLASVRLFGFVSYNPLQCTDAGSKRCFSTAKRFPLRVF